MEKYSARIGEWGDPHCWTKNTVDVLRDAPTTVSFVEMSEITYLLDSAAAGDPKAAAELLPLVYKELRELAAARMAAERVNHTLQATALVHEAYLRLVGNTDVPRWEGRAHFF